MFLKARSQGSSSTTTIILYFSVGPRALACEVRGPTSLEWSDVSGLHYDKVTQNISSSFPFTI